MKAASVRNLAKILKALANQRRLGILELLKKDGPQSVGQIARKINLSYRSTSKHLQRLEGCELVVHRQDRMAVFYSLSEPEEKTPHSQLLFFLLNLLQKD